MIAGRVLVEKHIAIPLRDGELTYADIFRPADGPRVPALITRTPYDKELWGGAPLPVLPSPLKLAERGYGVVVADVRGRFSSQGEFRPFMNESPDGYDTIEWAAVQDWCDGGVGIFGPSYGGATALLAARERPPSLKCVIPIITADDYYDGWIYYGGAPQLGFAAQWGLALAITQYERGEHAPPPEHRSGLLEAQADFRRVLSVRPLADLLGLSSESVAPWWREWLEHERRDPYWEAVRISSDYHVFDVPMLHVGGWFDIFGLGTVRNFRGLTAAGKAQHHLIMGPWAHLFQGRYLGEMDFGPTGAAGMAGYVNPLVDGSYNGFLDQHLKGLAWSGPIVRYFLMGANEWREAETWPPSEGQLHTLYLHSGGSANSDRGDGVLSEVIATGTEPPDRYLYDPSRPVPTEGGPVEQWAVNLPGPRDQRAIEARDDVLCYSTPLLEQPLTVAGPITLELWAVSDAPDTDWTAKLVAVQPDGRALALADGISRARFRHSLSDPRPLTPGVPERYLIDLANTAYRFPAGGRIRLDVSSSNFPRFAPNPNTGRPVATETELRPAVQHVLHDADHPTSLSLWALPE